MFCNKLDTEGLIKYPSVMIATLLCVIGRNWFITKSSLKRVAYVLMEIGCPWNNLVAFYWGGGGHFPPKRVRVRGPRGEFSPQPDYRRSEFWPQPECRIFIKITQKEWRNMKMLQILPKESAYPTRGCSEKGGLKDGTSLLTLTDGVLIKLYAWTIVLEIDH